LTLASGSPTRAQKLASSQVSSGVPVPHSTKPPFVARTACLPLAAGMKFRALHEKTAWSGRSLGLWNVYSSAATGSDASSAAPGSNGLQPVSATFSGTLGSSRLTMANGKRASNVAERKRGRPNVDPPSPLPLSGRPNSFQLGTGPSSTRATGFVPFT